MSTAAAKFIKKMGAVETGLQAYTGIVHATTIATLASQTDFTLTAGSADNTAYADCTIQVIDATTSTQTALGRIGTYTGATKRCQLSADPGVYTMAVGDTVRIWPKDVAALAKLDVIDDFVDTEVAAILEDTSTTLDDFIDTEIATLITQVLALHNFREQESNYNLTAAANAGATTCFTVAGSPIWVMGLTLAANGVTTADLTSAATRVGNAASLHEFIGAATAVTANINAAGERLISAAVPVRLEVGDTIDVVLAGTGATAVDLDVNVLWHGTAANSALTPTA